MQALLHLKLHKLCTSRLYEIDAIADLKASHVMQSLTVKAQ